MSSEECLKGLRRDIDEIGNRAQAIINILNSVLIDLMNDLVSLTMDIDIELGEIEDASTDDPC